MAELAREYECGEALIWRALRPSKQGKRVRGVNDMNTFETLTAGRMGRA
jgi:hypothetical protein